MNNLFVFTIIFLLFLAGCTTDTSLQKQLPPCIDNDQGRNTNIQATSSGYSPEDAMVGNYTDYCQDDDHLREYFCTTEIEGFDGKEVVDSMITLCLRGCIEGRCYS